MLAINVDAKASVPTRIPFEGISRRIERIGSCVEEKRRIGTREADSEADLGEVVSKTREAEEAKREDDRGRRSRPERGAAMAKGKSRTNEKPKIEKRASPGDWT